MFVWDTNLFLMYYLYRLQKLGGGEFISLVCSFNRKKTAY